MTGDVETGLAMIDEVGDDHRLGRYGIQILRWGTEMGFPDAVPVVFGDQFDRETATCEDPSVQKVLQFGEVVGTLVNQGVLDRGLVLDLWWIEGLWARVGHAADRQRAHLGEPRRSENFEKLAGG